MHIFFGQNNQEVFGPNSFNLVINSNNGPKNGGDKVVFVKEKYITKMDQIEKKTPRRKSKVN